MAQRYQSNEQFPGLKSEMSRCMDEALQKSSTAVNLLSKAKTLSDQLDSSRAQLLGKKNSELTATKAKLQEIKSKIKPYIEKQKQIKENFGV